MTVRNMLGGNYLFTMRKSIRLKRSLEDEQEVITQQGQCVASVVRSGKPALGRRLDGYLATGLGWTTWSAGKGSNKIEKLDCWTTRESETSA